MTCRPRPPEPPSGASDAFPVDSDTDTTRRLARLMRQHDMLARLAVEQDSHHLPDYADTVGLLTLVESELLDRYPHAYDALLPVWLTRNTHVAHEPGETNPACSICAAHQPAGQAPTAV